MGENSKIEWTDHTFNPWIGCTKVSDGCKHCYAETMMDRRWGKVEWGPQGTRVRTSVANWKQPIKWNREAKAAGVRQRVFCASLADVFEDRHDTNSWRIILLELIELTHGLDWLLLTKRPENVVRLIQQAAGRSVENFFERNPHVWIGTSVENQAAAAERIPHLLSIPARVRFLSMEPLLGPVDLSDWLLPDQTHVSHGILTGDSLLDWVIVGGESGPKARPMHPDWVRSIRDQCQAAGVPFFFKQWGEYYPSAVFEAPNFAGGRAFRWPTGGRQAAPPGDRRGYKWIDENMVAVKVGKHTAGRMLDGREWNEFPEVG